MDDPSGVRTSALGQVALTEEAHAGALIGPAMSAAYPTPSRAWPTQRLRPLSANTAESLVLAALVLQMIGAAVLAIGIAYLFGFSYLHPYPYMGLALAAAAGVMVLGVLFLYFAYDRCYLRIQRGEYDAARAPTLVIGVLSLFLGLLPGIFYLMAYVTLGDAIRESQSPAGFAPGYVGASPAGAFGPQLACTTCGRVYGIGQFAFCPGCGHKLSG